jgi:hypothetical protein
MERRIAFIFLSLIIVISCAQSDNERELQRKQSWLEYYRINMENFDDTLNIDKSDWYMIDFNPNDGYYEIYNEFFIYSPDRKCYIDLDSYNLVLEKDSAGNLISYGGEVDYEVGLINIKAKQRLRIIFCGTACWPEEAEWIDNESVQIYGYSNIDNVAIPTIWEYNLNDKSLVEMKSNFVVKKAPGSYIQTVRLDNVKFVYH